tara:strand:+ start:207 stop:428 length:222 start_codon:yes stop_codon:yes gene_type:complete
MTKTLAKRLAPAMDANGCISYALALSVATARGKSVGIDFISEYGTAVGWSMGVDLGEFLVWIDQSADCHYRSL